MFRITTSSAVLGLALLAAFGWLVSSNTEPARATPFTPTPGLNVPTQRDGIVAEILVSTGDRVQPGTVIAQLDDRLATMDRDVKAAKLDSARADYELAVKTRDEAQKRQKTATALWVRRCIAEEEFRAAALACERAEADAAAKQATIKVAELEL